MRLLAAFLAAMSLGVGTGLLTGAVPPVRRARPADSRLRSRLPRIGIRAWARALGAGAFALIVAASAPVALAGAAVGWAGYRRVRVRRRLQTQAAIREAWPDGLRHVVAAVRSGSSIATALEDLAAAGPSPLRRLLGPFGSRIRMLGVVGALEAVRAEAADPTTDRVVEVLVLAHERGGTIVPVILDDLADATAADLAVAEEIRTSVLEQQLNARIVFVVPWVLLGLLTVRPGPYREFYGSAPGLVILGLGAALSLGGAGLVARLGRKPLEPRVLGQVPR